MTNFDKVLNNMFNTAPKFKLLCNFQYTAKHTCKDCPIREKCGEMLNNELIEDTDIEAWLDAEIEEVNTQ